MPEDSTDFRRREKPRVADAMAPRERLRVQDLRQDLQAVDETRTRRR
jgi:hypothetical protein